MHANFRGARARILSVVSPVIPHLRHRNQCGQRKRTKVRRGRGQERTRCCRTVRIVPVSGCTMNDTVASQTAEAPEIRSLLLCSALLCFLALHERKCVAGAAGCHSPITSPAERTRGPSLVSVARVNNSEAFVSRYFDCPAFSLSQRSSLPQPPLHHTHTHTSPSQLSPPSLHREPSLNIVTFARNIN